MNLWSPFWTEVIA